MRLYDGGRAPNPRRVRVFLKEKGITVPIVPVDLGAMEHRSDHYTAVNPLRLVPALELDDGTVITESIAICRYFEALQPEPALFGTDPVEIALVEMWQRRIELHLLAGVQQIFRHLHPGMKEHEVPQVAAWGEANKPRVLEFLALIGPGTGPPPLCGRRPLFGRRYYRADRAGFHAGGQAVGSGGIHPCRPLACGTRGSRPSAKA